MKARILAAATLIIFSLLFSGAASAAGANVSDKQPFAFDVWICDEPVALSGWFRTTFRSASDGAGGFHLISHLNAHGTGLGLFTGTSYQWNDSFEHLAINQPSSEGFAGTLVQRTHLISRGAMVNGHIWFTAHLTITPNQTVVVDWAELFIECY